MDRLAYLLTYLLTVTSRWPRQHSVVIAARAPGNILQLGIRVCVHDGKFVHHTTHSLDRLTGDGSLHPPDVTITGHVPSSVHSKPDINLQLADPIMSGMTSWTFPLRSDIRSVTGTGVDSQTKCFMCWYLSLQTTYMTEYRDSPVSDSVTDALLLSLAHYWRVGTP